MSKLEQLTDIGGFRAKVVAVLRDLDGHGQRPKIFETLRTRAEQAAKVRAGTSKTMASQHLPGKDGLARAADIADEQKGWNADKRFWFMVGASAMAHELGWGGFFGLSGRQMSALRAAIRTASGLGWPKDFDYAHIPIGWDPAHVQQKVNW